MSETDVLEVAFGHFSFEDPWRIAPNTQPVRLTNSADGSASRLPTDLVVYHDETMLFLLFTGRDDRLVATYREHDAPIWKEDVLEAFLAPATPAEYFEVEVSPLGTVFDARIVSPEGNRATMKVDQSWNCVGAWNALLRDYAGDASFTFKTVLAIPFTALGRSAPEDGEQWRANFYRIDRSPAGDEYTAWRPTRRNPPDFHVPAEFGTLVFRM